eukprot:359335_1
MVHWIVYPELHIKQTQPVQIQYGAASGPSQRQYQSSQQRDANLRDENLRDITRPPIRPPIQPFHPSQQQHFGGYQPPVQIQYGASQQWKHNQHQPQPQQQYQPTPRELLRDAANITIYASQIERNILNEVETNALKDANV